MTYWLDDGEQLMTQPISEEHPMWDNLRLVPGHTGRYSLGLGETSRYREVGSGKVYTVTRAA